MAPNFPLVIVGGLLLMLTFVMGDWQGGQCVSDLDCSVSFTKCYHDQCLCKPGYYYSVGSKTCVESCKKSDRQATFVLYRDALMTKISQNLQENSLEKCQEACVDHEDCEAINYRESLGQCRLVTVSPLAFPNKWKISREGWHFYQRECA